MRRRGNRKAKPGSTPRTVALMLILMPLCAGQARAQDTEERLSQVEMKLEQQQRRWEHLPRIHGILRGKYEYSPDLDASRFEVRNARLSAEGKLPLRSEYKLEVDLCDESSIKMKDAWVRVTPWKTLRLTIGQQRMPFSIDAHRNPSAQYFANRSFIAKQVGDMRDVGFQAGYDLSSGGNRTMLRIDGGIFNGSNLDNQKTAWFTSPGYSARIQYFPMDGIALVPSVQHQQIAERTASYTSVDFGAYYEKAGWHVEAEFLHKFYGKGAFDDCNAVNVMAIFKRSLKKKNGARFIQSIAGLSRYDYMQDHSSGKGGFVEGTRHLARTDAERHRMTLGITCAVSNPYFPTELRFNYEKYWYPHGGALKNEQDKLVCELMIRF